MSDYKWMIEAKRLLGMKIHEIPGAKDHAEIIKLFADAGHPEIKHEDAPWCAAFVGAVLHRSAITPSGSLMARSYCKWAEKLDAPVYGAICVKVRSGAPHDSPLGHVGFCLDFDKDHIIMIGGNQGDSVSIGSFKRSEFVAYRFPYATTKHLPVAEPHLDAKEATKEA